MTPQQAAAAYIAFYETLTPRSLDRLTQLCTAEVRFRDPFNEVTGVAAYRAVLEKMFEDLVEPRFIVQDQACSGQVCYLRWTFTFRMSPKGAPWVIEGMSEVHFDAEGRVTDHLDHWDSGAQFYARLPVVGWLIRWVRRRIALRHKEPTRRPSP